MLNSRNIALLRKDVALNCRKMIEIAARNGYSILVTGTVRDQEYQEYCFNSGTAKTKYPSFHGEYAGLAFDICKNKKGEEYSDEKFWKYCGELGRKMGFTWGGDWKSFPDRPHFQWDEHGKYSGNMVRNGMLPSEMPEYMEDSVTYEEFKNYLDRYMQELADAEPSEWSREDRAWAEENGIVVGNENGKMQYKAFCTREQMVAFLKRLANMIK